MFIKAQGNAKRTCLTHGVHLEWSFVNKHALIAEKSFGVLRQRKVNLFNKSRPTILGIGPMVILNQEKPRLMYGATVSGQLGFLKLKSIRPIVRYSVLFNSPGTSQWLGAGLSYKLLKGVGLRYSFNYPLIGQAKVNQWGHNLGVYFNVTKKKLGCYPKQKSKKEK
jgi:hypothetical protein